MRFRSLFKMLLLLAIASSLADLTLTLLGFSMFLEYWEINPYVRFLMLFLNPYLAVAVVSSITLASATAGYVLARGCLGTYPYSGSLRDVAKYLWDSENVRASDLSIFALTAFYAYLTYIHVTGALSWIMLFLKIAR